MKPEAEFLRDENLIVFLRHGKSRLDGRYIGKTDCGLSDEGMRQIEKLKPWFSGIRFGKIVCSPLKRCRESLGLLQITGDITFVGEFSEIDFGQWENMDFREIEKSSPQELERWFSSPYTFSFPGGEGIEEFCSRVERGWEKYCRSLSGPLLLVSHGGVIRVLLCYLLGRPRSAMFDYSPETGKIILLTRENGRYILPENNERKFELR